MGTVRFTHRAREDLLNLWTYIARQNLAAADRTYDRIEERCRSLCDYPQLGAERPDISAEARALLVERWLAIYRLTSDGVQIVRIVDGSRDLSNLDWT